DAQTALVWGLDGLHAGTLDLAILSGAEPPMLSARARRSPAALEREAKRRRRALEPGPDAQGIHRDLWHLDRLVLVSAPGVDPATAPHVTFRRGATTRALFEAYFPEADVVMELGSIAAVKGNVRAGVGVALVSESAVVDDLARGLLVHVPDPRTPLVRELHLAHRGEARLPPAAAALRDRLLSSSREAPTARRVR
ncbi:MAG: hypothetical protein KF901_30130, partial [Myxococcales bacterium]|nr:hypothetical protein [Myxococcales bacterium]